MPAQLHLAITDYRDEAHWRWVLTDARGKFLADHEVALDVTAAPYRFSGHGLAGELVLEDEAGEADRITADELAPLLRPARDRLRLLTLSACLSGAGSLADARSQLGLDAAATRQGFAATTTTALPSLAQQLSAELGCAALAMRYPVGDEFAIHLIGSAPAPLPCRNGGGAGGGGLLRHWRDHPGGRRLCRHPAGLDDRPPGDPLPRGPAPLPVPLPPGRSRPPV